MKRASLIFLALISVALLCGCQPSGGTFAWDEYNAQGKLISRVRCNQDVQVGSISRDGQGQLSVIGLSANSSVLGGIQGNVISRQSDNATAAFAQFIQELMAAVGPALKAQGKTLMIVNGHPVAVPVQQSSLK